MTINLKVGHSSKIMGEVKFLSTPEAGINIHELVVIRGPVEIGAGTTIKDSAYIGPNTIIGENCLIGPHAVIGDTTEHDVELKYDPDHLYTSEKPEMTVLENMVVIGSNATVKAGSFVKDGSIVLPPSCDIRTGTIS